MADDRDATANAGRRDFIGLAIAGTATALGVAAAFPALAFIRPGNRGMAGIVSVGKVQSFPVGSARIVLLDDRPVLVIRLPDGDFRAVVAVCTHLGCIVRYSPEHQRIECPCHRGIFGLDGSNVSGPPPRPLKLLTAAVEDGILLIRDRQNELPTY